MCSQQLCFYFERIISWYQKFTLQSSTMSFAFRKLLTSGSHMNRFNKTEFFPWNTKNTDRNGINKQSTHTYTKHLEKDWSI